MGKVLNLINQKFGKLTVLSKEENNKHGFSRWLCSCECGSEKVFTGSTLKSGHTSSCGCFQKEQMAKACTTHGHAKHYTHTSEYGIWCQLKARCLNENNKGYEDYGARGIVVCDRWMIFENFLSDMGKRPTENHSIDRMNNDGNYSKENCRWTTPTEQLRNQRVRKNNTTGIRGVSWNKDLNKYRVRININRKSISVGLTKSLEEAKQMRIKAEEKYWKSS